jgi:ATP-dependent RNA helicase DeaD
MIQLHTDPLDTIDSGPAEKRGSAEQQKQKQKQRRDFSLLDLSPRRLNILREMGYEKPTPVQAGLIPLVLAGNDLIGQARTGTGKTAAFGIPIVERLEAARAGQGADDHSTGKTRYPRALILVPTRELCVQVHQEILRISGQVPDDPEKESSAANRNTGSLRSVAVYGGTSIRWQINRLAAGADIVVGTPGRIIDHLQRGTLNVQRIDTVVLDEADRMLDIGFRPDIERILKRIPQDRQMLLLSATLPPPILHLARNYMREPKLVNFSSRSVATDTIDQYYLTVRPDDKFDMLVRLLMRENPRQAIIFCRTRLGTERLYRKLIKVEGFEHARAIHGDLSQPMRDAVMASFRRGETRILVATDVVGRGIDVTDISHIINFDIPELSDDYVHRVGRTGRMGREGTAYSLVTPLQRSELRQIEARIGKELQPYHLEGFEMADIKSQKSTQRRARRYRKAL